MQAIPSVNGGNGGGNGQNHELLQIAGLVVDLAHSIPEQTIIRGQEPITILVDGAYFETRVLNRRLQELREAFAGIQSKRVTLEIK